jgi:splicing factor U2AF subunit
MNKESLVVFLGNAMRQAGLATKGEGNPIIGCEVCGDFALLELRSVEETTNAMYLNNIGYLGVRLHVRRPSKYAGPDTPTRDWDEVLTGFITGSRLPLCNPETSPMIEHFPKAPLEMTKQSTVTAGLKYTASEPTRILKLENMLSKEELKCDSEYDDIVLETREECSEFGTLKNVIIPRTGKHAAKIFLEYETEEDAVNAMKQLAGRMFDGQKVKATYCTELVLKETLRKSRFGRLKSQ